MKKREPDDASVGKLAGRYIQAETRLREILLHPKQISLHNAKKRFDTALAEERQKLTEANRRFAGEGLKRAYREGAQKAERAFLSAGGLPPPGGGTGAAKTVRRGAFMDLQRGLEHAAESLRRQVARTIRELDDSERNLNAFTEAIQKTLQENGVLEVKYRNGAKIRLGHYARMLSRSSRMETANLGCFDRASELGSDLVKCTRISPTCELCAMYQDRVYSISGRDKRFPALYETALSKGYALIHPNCRHEFRPYFEELEGEEQVAKDIEASNRPFADNRTKRERDGYAAWQADNRRRWAEEAEYEAMKNTLGPDMPYATLGGFRRAKRAGSDRYFAVKASERVRRKHETNLTKARESGIINIQIDELTPCLRDSETGQLVDTDIAPATVEETSGLRKKGWNFDWNKPFRDGETVCKLTLKGDNELQGLIAIREDAKDKAFYVDIVEAAPHNIGRNGRYKGVGGHLFAIACRESVKAGYGGFVYFDAKTNLIEHYHNVIGANLISGQRMYISEQVAEKLIRRYFHDNDDR